jgi:hypothetical protein
MISGLSEPVLCMCTRRKKERLFAVLLVCWAVASPADEVTMLGLFNCSYWQTVKDYPVKTWLLGYLSGLNSSQGSSKRDPLAQLNSPSDLYERVDNYCERYPEAQLVYVADLLYKSLQESLSAE